MPEIRNQLIFYVCAMPSSGLSVDISFSAIACPAIARQKRGASIAMNTDSLNILQGAGISQESLAEEQRTVLETPSPEEASGLASILEKMSNINEIEGQIVVGAGVF